MKSWFNPEATKAVEDYEQGRDINLSEANIALISTNLVNEPVSFDEAWKAAGIVGLPGHRSTGGYRASMYNALPIESVQVLVDVMQDFESKVAEMNF